MDTLIRKWVLSAKINPSSLANCSRSSDCTQAKSRGNSGSRFAFEFTSAVELAFLAKVVVDRRMNDNEFLQAPHLSKATSIFSSPKWQVRILYPIVDQSPGFLLPNVSDDRHRRTLKSQFVRHNYMWLAMPIHWFSREFQCYLTITNFVDIGFEYLPFVIFNPPKILSFFN